VPSIPLCAVAEVFLCKAQGHLTDGQWWSTWRFKDHKFCKQQQAQSY